MVRTKHKTKSTGGVATTQLVWNLVQWRWLQVPNKKQECETGTNELSIFTSMTGTPNGLKKTSTFFTVLVYYLSNK